MLLNNPLLTTQKLRIMTHKITISKGNTTKVIYLNAEDYTTEMVHGVAMYFGKGDPIVIEYDLKN